MANDLDGDKKKTKILELGNTHFSKNNFF